MEIFQWTLMLMVGAVGLTALARRINVPYPSLLALGGVALVFAADGAALASSRHSATPS